MKKFSLIAILCLIAQLALAQISDIQVRFGADAWSMNYVASTSQINCGLCPQLIKENPEINNILDGLQDSIIQDNYVHGGVMLNMSASIIWPALRAELQAASSMRRLNVGQQVSTYVNRNISAILGIAPMKSNPRAGKYLLGRGPRPMILDMSDIGIYTQFSYDGGFEEFVRSTQNIAAIVRWQPTIWLNRLQRVGLSLRAGGRMWLLGNRSPQGPFIDSSGLPKKVKPSPGYFLGISFIARPFDERRRGR